MISFDFDYYRPDTLEEAANCYCSLAGQGKSPVYYGGGTEIISMARADSLRFGAVIDLKGIPQCNALEEQGCKLIIGSAVTLTAIAESGLFPLLGDTVSRIADHTIQGKITLGGNLGGSIIYREAALPLMVSGCRAMVMTRAGLTEMPFSQIFDGRLRLEPGAFLAQVLIDKADVTLPYNHVKKTKTDKIDYPLVSMTAIKKGSLIRAAVSGAARVPVLLSEAVLNDAALPHKQRIEQAVAEIDGLIIDDLHGSKEYRRFVLMNILEQLFANLEGENA